MSEAGKELAIREPKAELVAGQKVAPIVPRTIEEVARVAKAVIVAGLAPDSYRGGDEASVVSKIMIGIMKGAEIGLAPLTALANIAIINGRPCLYGDGAVALVQGSGLVENWTENWEGDEGADSYTAICKIWRKGQNEPYIGRFSYADAKRAKLLAKGPWVMYLSRMLMWRARTYAMRTGFADCLSGLAIAEEIQDLGPAPKAHVDSGFLEDSTVPQEAQPAANALPDTPKPEPEIIPPVAAAEAQEADAGRDDLEGYIEALPNIGTIARLDEIDAEVRTFLKKHDRADDLLPVWNAAKLERQRQIGKLKTKT